MKPAEMIFFGRNNVEDTSGHVNPCVKLTLLFLPLAFVAYQQIGRLKGWGRLDISETTVVALVLFIAIILNFRDNEIHRMIRRIVLAVMFFGGLFVVVRFPKTTVAAILGIFSKTFSSIPVLGKVAPESWLYITFFFIAVIAVRSFNSRDTLWIGRRFLLWWDRLFVVYVIVITTFCVINSSLPLRLALSWRVASDKATLAGNPYQHSQLGWIGRQSLKWRLFALTLFSGNSGIAQSIHLLCEQRGFFRRGYRDAIGRQVSAEDIIALILLMLGTVTLLLLRLDRTL